MYTFHYLGFEAMERGPGGEAYNYFVNENTMRD